MEANIKFISQLTGIHKAVYEERHGKDEYNVYTDGDIIIVRRGSNGKYGAITIQYSKTREELPQK